MARDFASEAASLRARLDSDRFVAVNLLCQLEEDWARHLLGIGEKGNLPTLVRRKIKAGVDGAAAEQAEAHLAEAERWQREIGSYATGSGEGLMSMAEVLAFQMARAWLAAALSREKGGKSRATLARSLAKKIEDEPNGMGKRYAKLLVELRDMLGHK